MCECAMGIENELHALTSQQWPAGTRFVANISGKKVFWLGVVMDSGKPYVYKAIPHRQRGLFAVERDDRCIRIYPNGKTVTAFHKLYEFRLKKKKLARQKGRCQQSAERQRKGSGHETQLFVRPPDTCSAA